MDNLSLSLPTSPKGVDTGILMPSQEFKKNVSKVFNALVAFVIVYLLLVIAAIAIAGAMIALGIGILITVHVLLFMAFGIGLILSGGMLIFFLVKFLFTKGNPGVKRYEITEESQPELFHFIRDLTLETAAPFPKHVYLTPEVNASVFFDSSFWSMFFPVKKNLNIGLALVNTLNQSEFKAVLAHEFGHFSQRSMRFGSYVYNLNKVIYKILYENSGYYNMLNAWARTHYILRLAAVINVKVVKGIQYVLKKMYVNINKAHLGLSREMEFHADAMAGYYGGTNNMIAALRRIEAGSNSYDILLNFLNNEINKGAKSVNIYPQHVIVLQQFAIEHQLVIDNNGLPVINKGIAALNNAKVILNDQWASHPTMANREAKLSKLDVMAEPVNKSAWLLFRDAEKIQEDFTTHLYAATSQSGKEYAILDNEKFRFDFEKEISATSYNKAYGSFYKNRAITLFDIDDAIGGSNQKIPATFNEFFTDENCNLPNVIAGMENDIKLLDIISAKKEEAYTFDFEGVKYTKDDAQKIKTTINERLKKTNEQLAALDKAAFLFFYMATDDAQLKDQLAWDYKKMFEYQEASKQDYGYYDGIMRDISPIYTKMKPAAIYETLKKVYNKEPIVKARIKALMTTKNFTDHINEDQKTAIETYISETHTYYYEPNYNNRAIGIFNNGINAYISVISGRNFNQKKKLFDFQLTLIK